MGQFKLATSARDRINDSLQNVSGIEEMISLREDNENKRLKSLVLNIDNPDKILETPEKYIQKFEPGYMKATSKYGRAHFYAPYKFIGNIEIDTYWFNIIGIWLVSLLLYLVLYLNFLQKLMTWFENLRLPTTES